MVDYLRWLTVYRRLDTLAIAQWSLSCHSTMNFDSYRNCHTVTDCLSVIKRLPVTKRPSWTWGRVLIDICPVNGADNANSLWFLDRTVSNVPPPTTTDNSYLEACPSEKTPPPRIFAVASIICGTTSISYISFHRKGATDRPEYRYRHWTVLSRFVNPKSCLQ